MAFLRSNSNFYSRILVAILAIPLLTLFSSGCSSDFNRNEIYDSAPVSIAATSTDIFAPDAPSSWAMSNPSDGATSAYDSPTISGTASEESAVIKIWINDATCTTGNHVSTATVVLGAFNASAFTVTGDGAKVFYYTITDTIGNTSSCATTGLNYTYQSNPIYNFSRPGYTIKENESQVGTPVTVSRDVIGIAGTATVTISSASAISGSDFTAATLNVNFGVTDYSVTITSTDFTISDDATIEGDEFAKLTLAVTSGGVVGTTIPVTQLNIIDDEVTGDYIFASPFYSVNENGTSLNVIVQRVGSTAAAGQVNVDFLSGTANGATDFDAVSQAASFNIGDDEETVTISISDNSNADDNRSFYIKLENPSTSTYVRSQSIAKVRILDDDSAVTCDSTNNNVGVNGGFGGGDGLDVSTPYRVCSLAQLYRIRNNLTSYFRIMADIDVSTSLDADPNTGGTQEFTPISGFYTGKLDGDEHIISNFSYTGSGAADTSNGLFKGLGGAVLGNGSLKDLNLMYASVTNVSQSGLIFGIAGSGANHLPNLTDLFAHGYLATVSDYGGLVGSTIDLSMASTSMNARRLMSAGAVSAGGHYHGGVIGYITGNGASPSLTYSKLFNTANILGGAIDAVGGVIGRYGGFNAALSTFDIDQFENRGIVYHTGNHAGGIIGLFNAGHNIRITHSVNFGNIFGKSEISGIVGYFMPVQTTTTQTIESSTNYGAITFAPGQTGQDVGGIAGYLYANGTTAITSNMNYGSITGKSAGVGGIVGDIFQSVTSSTVNLQENRNYSTITATTASAYAGGIFGRYLSSGANSGFTLSIVSNEFSGTLTHNNPYAGGIGGYCNFQSTGTNDSNDISENSFTSTGVITSTSSNVGGICGALVLATSLSTTVTMDDNTMEGTITGTSNVGGVVGFTNLAHHSTYTANNTSINGTITGTANVGGSFGYINDTKGAGESTTITFTHSTIDGTITAPSGKVGGLIGYAFLTETTAISLINNSSRITSLSSDNSVGGLIGSIELYDNPTLTITNCNSSTNITSTNSYAGGLIGHLVVSTASGASNTSITTSYATGNIDAFSAAGGFVGLIVGTIGGDNFNITNSYTSGSVHTGTGGSSAGFIGNAEMFDITITNSFSNSEITADAGSIGGLLGEGGIGYTLSNTNSFYQKDMASNITVTRDDGTVAGQTANKTIAELTTPATFSGAGWDMTTVWYDPVLNTTYPTLR